MKNVKEAVEIYLRKCPPALELFQQLLEVGEVYLIGGILREYRDNNDIKELRDADFIIDIKRPDLWEMLLEKYHSTGNRFDGYKFDCESGFVVDVWEVDKTWAYRQNLIEYDRMNYLQTLPDTVFLNMDSIIYDLNEDKWYDSIYQEAVRQGVLDIVLKENPYVELNLLRAMILRRKYSMRYSEYLRNVFLEYMQKNEGFVDDLMEIQYQRYHHPVLSKQDIVEELQQFKRI